MSNANGNAPADQWWATPDKASGRPDDGLMIARATPAAQAAPVASGVQSPHPEQAGAATGRTAQRRAYGPMLDEHEDRLGELERVLGGVKNTAANANSAALAAHTRATEAAEVADTARGLASEAKLRATSTQTMARAAVETVNEWAAGRPGIPGEPAYAPEPAPVPVAFSWGEFALRLSSRVYLVFVCGFVLIVFGLARGSITWDQALDAFKWLAGIFSAAEAVRDSVGSIAGRGRS